MKEINVKNSGYIILPKIEDGIDGTISIAEHKTNIPFEIKRVYYIYNIFNNNAIRGKHAHKDLEQVLFCINGMCGIELDDGYSKQIIELNKPNIGIKLGKELWHTMKDFSDNCILMVLASDIYKESDYVRSYKEFLNLVRK